MRNVIANCGAEARKHTAAHPEIIATSAEKDMWLPELPVSVLVAVKA